MKYSGHLKALYCDDRECRGCQEKRFTLNQPLVRYVVRKYFPRSCIDGAYGADRDYADFLQSGFAGLWHACARRDPDKNDAEWRGYAFLCIYGYILSSMREGCRDGFKEEHGYWPVLKQVDFNAPEKRSRTSYDSEDTRNNGLKRAATEALEAKQYELGNRPWWNLDEFAGSESVLLAMKVEQLPERLRLVIETRLDGHSLEVAGDKLGLTRERARQLQTKALRQLFQLFHGRTANDQEIHEMSHALAQWGT